MYLGVDGGGTKTAFALVGPGGDVLARHEEAGLYYPQIGLDAAAALLHNGVGRVLAKAGVNAPEIEFTFVGLPSYGEDSTLTPELDRLPQRALPTGRFRCGNDVECGWAGSLAGEDGVSVVAGTGSIAYGQRGDRCARSGGWGEIFGDEGSAYWIAREGLALFSCMSDGRLARGPLYDIVRQELRLVQDLDLCAWVYGRGNGRADLAQLAPLVGRAADAGDEQACLLFERAAAHLVTIIKATIDQLDFAGSTLLRVSYSGGVLEKETRALAAFRHHLLLALPNAELRTPAMPPVLGAALLAARYAGRPLDGAALHKLKG